MGWLNRVRAGTWLAALLLTAFAGPLVAQTPNMDRPGSDFLALDMLSGDISGCIRLCAAHQRCQAYSYVREANHFSEGHIDRCYLKDGVPDPVPLAGVRSGARSDGFPEATGLPPERWPDFPTPRGGPQMGWSANPVRGRIPLLSVVVRYPPRIGAGGLSTAVQTFRPGWTAREFDELVFGSFGRDSYNGSIAAFYRLASDGQFGFAKAGSIGPVELNPDARSPIEAAVRGADQGGFDFSLYDRNGDDVVESSELMILLIDNATRGGGVATGACWWSNDRGHVSGRPIQVCGVAAVGSWTGMVTAAHEIGHRLGALDLYGPWRAAGGPCWSEGFTVMSCAGGDADAARIKEALDFDPWHRMYFGWASPVFARADQSSEWQIQPGYGAAQDRPLVIWDPTRGLQEFYIVESRNAYNLDDTLLRSVSSHRNGVVIWYVRMGLQGQPMLLTGGIGTGADGVLDTWVSERDIVIDTNQDGRPDTIDPGADGVMDSVADPRDATGDYPMVYATFDPGEVAGGGTLIAPGHPPVGLTWFDGTPVGVLVYVNSGRTRDSQSVQLVTLAEARTSLLPAATWISPTVSATRWSMSPQGAPPLRPDIIPEGLQERLRRQIETRPPGG
jgi:M6 family metalloprotease-like protein